MARGEEGHPGEPGEPGEHGGGAGGTGGRGGRGGRGGEVKFIWVLAFFLILSVALTAVTVIIAIRVSANANKIAAIQRHDEKAAAAVVVALRKSDAQQDAAITLIRQTDYRLCLRGQITRAALNLHLASDPLGKIPQLPLYDCQPGLIGKPAVRLDAAETKSLEQYILTSKNLP